LYGFKKRFVNDGAGGIFADKPFAILEIKFDRDECTYRITTHSTPPEKLGAFGPPIRGLSGPPTNTIKLRGN